jgi:predicted phosphodiesterase
MRIALISDIHGNAVFLQAVLADIAQRGVERVICLGDVALMGPQPREVMALLQAHHCPCILGNHDEELLDPEAFLAGMNGPPMSVAVGADWLAWCASLLSPADLDVLRTYRRFLALSLDPHTRLLCFHGSPRSNTEFIFATTPAAELDRMLGGQSAAVMAGGHTHIQMLRRYKETLIVNPGSVGLPLEQLPFPETARCLPWAEYAIIDAADGHVGVELRRVPVDMEAAFQAALDSKMPHADVWIAQWTAPEKGTPEQE